VTKGRLLPPATERALPRVIPCLLIDDQRLVKTVAFKDPKYVGDPLNAVRILNEKQVDELVFLDIGARRKSLEPDLGLIESIARECFMPFAYGGGIRSMAHIRRILSLGAEKVVLNTAALQQPDLVREAAREFGSQSVVVSMDVGRNWLGAWRLLDGVQAKLTGRDPLAHAREMVALGAGEIFVNDVDHDGKRQGYDLKLVAALAGAVQVPVVACGGAGTLLDMRAAIEAGAAAAAAGSMFVLYGKHRAVLITYPTREEVRRELAHVAS
jgi:imidazole glycerol-phosphate synthase subunit HisF